MIIDISKILSFEKNPDKNGIPHNDKFEIKNIIQDKGKNFFIFPKYRISWKLIKLWIKIPEHINIIDLNIAWIIKWKNLKSIFINEKIIIINPICLNVE